MERGTRSTDTAASAAGAAIVGAEAEQEAEQGATAGSREQEHGAGARAGARAGAGAGAVEQGHRALVRILENIILGPSMRGAVVRLDRHLWGAKGARQTMRARTAEVHAQRKDTQQQQLCQRAAAAAYGG